MNQSTDSSARDPASGAGTSTAVETTRPSAVAEGENSESRLLAYVVPMFAYLGLTALEGYLPRLVGTPSPLLYPTAYAVKLVFVGLLAWHYRATWKDFQPRPNAGAIALGMMTGFLVCGLWVGLDGHYPTFNFLGGSRSAFDPFVLAPAWRWAFLGVRLLGLVVLVPVFEELFWRSFLLRWLIDNDFTRMPIGKVTPLAAAATSVLFALAHPEWLPALLTGALWAWLLWWTRSLSACLISHATANLALGVYVIVTHAWKFW
jgi:CAAX prenyl protease-like protein